MFSHKSLPSKVYSYGCHLEGPRQEVYEILRNANRYRNKLVEIERERRGLVDELTCRLCPELNETESRISRAEEDIENVVKEIKKANAAGRSRSAAPKKLREELRSLKKHLSELRATRKVLRSEVFGSKKFKVESKEIDDKDKMACIAARKDSQLYWGTYLTVEHAMQSRRKGSPPQFKRFIGKGKLAVQLQNGASENELRSGSDTRIRIEPLSSQKRKAGSRRFGRKHRIWFRIGSDGRKPKWATLIVEMHRPLPEGCEVKWVYLVAKRIATHTKWFVQFVVSKDGGFPRDDDAKSGSVAINLGWRTLNGGEMRVAYALGDDGQRYELDIPCQWMRRIPKSESLRSIRDRNFNEIRDKLLTWMKTQFPRGSAEGQWLQERLKTLSHWRSQSHLAVAVILWRDMRFKGDEKMFQAVESWRKQDKHLYDWEQFNQTRFFNWRMDFYRVFSRMLRRKYKRLVMAKVDWRKFQSMPADDEETDEMRIARTRKRIASPSVLSNCLQQAFAGNFELLKPKNITKTCHKCGNLSKHNPPDSLIHSCEGCGASYDQDYNACANLLKVFSGGGDSREAA